VLVPVPFGLGLPVWADAARFEIRRHLRRIRLAQPGGRDQLMEMAAKLHSRHLDRSRPLWEMYLIDGVADDRVAVYAKLHHAMADGISAVELGLVLLDLDPNGELAPSVPDPPPPQPAPSPLSLLAATPREAAGGAAAMLRRAAEPLPWPVGSADSRALNGGPARRLAAPRTMAFDVAAVAARGTAAGFGAALSLRDLGSVMRPAPSSPFNRRVGRGRRVEAVQLPLGGAKLIKERLGGTVNDVVLAVTAEALHAYLEHRGEITTGVSYRVMVPISLRADTDRMKLEGRLERQLDVSNRIIGTFVDLPVGPMDVMRRYWAVKQLMSKAKGGQADAAGRFMDVASLSPAAVQRAAIRAGLSNQRLVNLVISNVPGVQMPLYAGGSRLLEVYPTLPLTPNTGLIICVLSYDNNLHFGIVADPNLLPDIDILPAGLARAFERLRKAAGRGSRSKGPQERELASV
jgi:WS/DGAT/MGAT family acyltransferase